MKKKIAAGFVSLVSGIVLSGCANSTADIAAVPDFQPEKYMGVWYEIVRLPHYFERGLDHVKAEYSLKPDGMIQVVNRGRRNGEIRRIVGKAKLKNPSDRPMKGELRVSFFGPFYSDYRIIELGPDYSYAVITGSNKNYLWILSRQPTMPKLQLREILDRLKKHGFRIDRLEYPRQTEASPHRSGSVPDQESKTTRIP